MANLAITIATSGCEMPKGLRIRLHRNIRMVCLIVALSLVVVTVVSANVLSTAIVSIPSEQISPALAYSPDAREYLVVWDDGWMWSGTQIRGQRVADTGANQGEPISISWFMIGDVAMDPDVVYNAATHEYFVVYEYRGSPEPIEGISGRRVSAGGMLVGNQLFIQSGDLCNPSVAYSSGLNRYLVVYGVAGGHEIWGQFVEATGTTVAPPFSIRNSTEPVTRPDVAYNAADGSYLVVWEEDLYGLIRQVFAQRVSATGQMIGGLITISDENAAVPRVAYGIYANEFLVVWIQGSYPDTNVHAQRVAASGSLAGAPIVVWNPAVETMFPDVTYNPLTHRYLVTWEQVWDSTDHDILSRPVASNGTLEASHIITNEYSNEASPAVASGRLNSLLVVWEDARNAATLGTDIYGTTAEIPMRFVFLPCVMRQ